MRRLVLALLFAACLVLLWEMPRRLRDGTPASIYSVLRMLPATPGTVVEMRPIAAVAAMPPPPGPGSVRL